MENGYTGLEVAVIGMACRVPQAENHREFWAGLLEGFEPMEKLSTNDIIRSGVEEKTARSENYVRIARRLKNKKYFDPGFFKFNRNEAPLLSPQTRLLHECLWEAVEDTGNDIKSMENTGLFISLIEDFNWQMHVRSMRDQVPIDFFSFNFLTAHHFTPALLSYKFGFQGVTLPVISACSSSLVAIHSAYKSLLLGESRIAIAGGANTINHSEKGYLFQDGNIESRDGRCRSFDKDSTGTCWGEGVGVVVLKRLKDALKDNDHIYCLIKGGACNNDAGRRVGYTAPSVAGQAECIAKAFKFSQVTPDSISYVETHGTGTQLGDPIEVEALNRAFDLKANDTIPIGSVKSNIGHTSYSAGILGFIKGALCLKHRTIPASINFTAPNPTINFHNGPFYVNAKLSPLEKKGNYPLRVSVTSLGIGGTNAHMILEEAPAAAGGTKVSSPAISGVLTISAKTAQALQNNAASLLQFLEKETPDLEDIAYTYRLSRSGFDLRRSFVVTTREKLVEDLQAFIRSGDTGRPLSEAATVFIFSGQGSQYLNMGKPLYTNSTVFREYMDIAFTLLGEITGDDYRDAIFSDTDNGKLDNIEYTHPLIFAFQYAYARLLLALGIRPAYMAGYSLGEYTAACLAGVFSFSDGLRMIHKRATLMQQLPPGRMISVNSTRPELEQLLAAHPEVYVSGENSRDNYVVAGLPEPVNAFAQVLDAANIYYRDIAACKPFHTHLLSTIVEEYTAFMSRFTFHTPEIPFISSLTGDFIQASEAVSPAYWNTQMKSTVMFKKGMEKLLGTAGKLQFLDIGPHNTSSKMVRNIDNTQEVLTFHHKQQEFEQCLTVLGQLWEQGAEISWEALLPNGRKVPVPTYAFDKNEFIAEVRTAALLSGKKEKPRAYVSYRENWITDGDAAADTDITGFRDKKVLIFSQDEIIAARFAQYAADTGHYIITPGHTYRRSGNQITLDPASSSDFEALFADLRSIGYTPTDFLFIWADDQPDTAAGISYGYTTLFHLVRAHSSFFFDRPLNLSLVADGLFKVYDRDRIFPVKATAAGAVKIINIEFKSITCRITDTGDFSDNAIRIAIKGILSPEPLLETAIRKDKVYTREYEEIALGHKRKHKITAGKTYLITGGLRGLGFEVAKYLAGKYKSNLVIIGRSEENITQREELEKLGSHVRYIRSDLTGAAHLTAAIRDAEALLGPVKGVIHAAGVGDYNGIILRRGLDNDADVFNPKVNGTVNLYEALKENKLDFFAGYSSRAVSKPFIGQFAYTAANSFLDSFMIANNGVSVHWPAVSGVGMAIDALKNVPENQHEAILSRTITPEKMIEVLFRAIRSKERLVVVSKTEIDTRTGYILGVNEEMAQNTASSREQLTTGNAYTAPETEMETGVAGIIREVLCIDKVGMKDNMFELGGDSLKAMVILNKIKTQYNVDYALKSLLEADDVACIVKDLEEILEDKVVITI